MFDEKLKEEVYAEARARVSELFRGHEPRMAGACLYWALAAWEALKKRGYRAILQAGSMQWPRVDPEQDDGKINTHVSFMWHPDSPASALAVRLGDLPEMHVWVAAWDEHGDAHLVDLSVGLLPLAAERMGFAWPGAKPPRYLWAQVDDDPGRVRYVPEPAAVRYVAGLFGQARDTMRRAK